MNVFKVIGWTVNNGKPSGALNAQSMVWRFWSVYKTAYLPVTRERTK